MPATPCNASPCVALSHSASPCIATTPSQQQHFTTKSRIQKEQERQRTICCLENKAKHDFDRLELPDVIPKYLREQLYAKFRESISPKDFVDRVEKEMKASLRHLPPGFELDNDSKEKIKRIPSQISLDYIIEERTEEDGLVNKAKPTGWEAIAKVLKDAVGFGYTKASCKSYYDDWMKKQRNQGLQEQSKKRHISKDGAQNRRSHSPDEDVPSKTPRYSASHLSPGQSKMQRHAEAHMSPGQCSTQSEHSSLAVVIVEDTVMGNSAPSVSSPFTLPRSGSLSEQALCDTIKQAIAQREQAIQEMLLSEKEQMLRENRKMEKEKRDCEEQLRSVQYTSLRAVTYKDECIAQLESENATMAASLAQLQQQSVEYTARIAQIESDAAMKTARIHQLESEISAKWKLQGELDAAIKETHKLSSDIEVYRSQLYTRTTIQPNELNHAPAYGVVSPSRSAKQTSEIIHSDPMLSVEDSSWSSQNQTFMLNEFEQFKVSGIARDSAFFSDSGSTSS